MVKNKWIKTVLVIGGLALLAKLIHEANKNKNKIYRCQRCNYPLTRGEGFCPNCGQPIDWGDGV